VTQNFLKLDSRVTELLRLDHTFVNWENESTINLSCPNPFFGSAAIANTFLWPPATFRYSYDQRGVPGTRVISVPIRPNSLGIYPPNRDGDTRYLYYGSYQYVDDQRNEGFPVYVNTADVQTIVDSLRVLFGLIGEEEYLKKG
jgi:hypothetical protein